MYPAARMRTALQALSPQQRTIVYLADVEGYSYREIADFTGTHIEAVRTRLHRSRRRLLDLLADQADTNAAISERWGGWDSNPRPADYESAALTS